MLRDSSLDHLVGRMWPHSLQMLIIQIEILSVVTCRSGHKRNSNKEVLKKRILVENIISLTSVTLMVSSFPFHMEISEIT
jgi:hypothetical protein